MISLPSNRIPQGRIGETFNGGCSKNFCLHCRWHKKKTPAGTESYDVRMSKIIPREIDLSNPEKDKCTTKTSGVFSSFFSSSTPAKDELIFSSWPKIACAANAICWWHGEQGSPSDGWTRYWNERGLGSQDSQDEGYLPVSMLRRKFERFKEWWVNAGQSDSLKIATNDQLRKRHFQVNPHYFEATMSILNDITLEE